MCFCQLFQEKVNVFSKSAQRRNAVTISGFQMLRNKNVNCQL